VCRPYSKVNSKKQIPNHKNQIKFKLEYLLFSAVRLSEDFFEFFKKCGKQETNSKSQEPNKIQIRISDDEGI